MREKSSQFEGKIQLAHSDSDTSTLINCFIRVDLKRSNFDFSDSEKMELPIWQRWFCSVSSPCPCIAEELHWIHPSHRVEKWLFWLFGVCAFFKLSWNFLRHLADAEPVLQTNNISPVCRYVIEIWPVMIACNWENCVLLGAFWDKISSFHLGQTEHRSALGEVHLTRRIALLLASFDVALPPVDSARFLASTRLNRLKNWDFPLHSLSFARSVPRARRSRFRVSHHATQESEQNLLRNRVFFKFCLVSPDVGPEA